MNAFTARDDLPNSVTPASRAHTAFQKHEHPAPMLQRYPAPRYHSPPSTTSSPNLIQSLPTTFRHHTACKSPSKRRTSSLPTLRPSRHPSSSQAHEPLRYPVSRFSTCPKTPTHFPKEDQRSHSIGRFLAIYVFSPILRNNANPIISVSVLFISM